MNADRLLANFNTLVDTPGAVPRLRRFILDLAVRGKLVPQDPNDEPASELLARVAAETPRYEADRVTMMRPNHSLPNAWQWVAVGNLFAYDAGVKSEPNAIDPDVWVLDLQDIEKDTGRLLARVTAAQRISKSTKSEFRAGDILYGKLRPYLNKVLVANEHGYSTTEIVALRSYIPLYTGYCALAFRRPDFVNYVTRVGQGTKMPRLRRKDALVAPFPLPPLAEQHRIVVKVDELMTLCDRLEEARQEREAARDRFAATNLARLSSPDPDLPTFRSDAAFVTENFDRITARSDQVAALRRTILDLAVHGRLVPQDPTDEPASELLRRTHGKNVKRIGSTREPSAKDIGCHPDLNGWAIAPLGALLVFHYGKGMSAKERLRKGPVPVFGSNGMVGFCENPLTEESAIIVGRKGSAGALNLCDGPSWTTDVAYYVEAPSYLDIRFLFIQLQALDLGSLGKGVKPGLSRNDAYQLSLGVPPLEEQRRIVARVDEMMALCDRLVDRLATTEDTCTSMLDVVLHEALESVHYGRVTGAVGAGQVTADG